MKNLYFALSFVLLFPFDNYSQEFRTISFVEFQEILEAEEGPTVVNFWATWCRPCIAELPYFEALNDQLNQPEEIRVILVSLDFPEVANTKLEPFLVKKNIQSEVLLLDETDFDTVIRKIDESWSGAIPATLFVNRRKNIKKFHEGELSAAELLRLAQTTL